MNLVDQSSNEVFIAGDNLGQERFQDTDDITTRLGQAGLVGDWGSVQIGKQWSVYYDVTQWTDLFWAVGGNASGTYNAGTDGGISGTGRAEKAVSTRFRYHGLRLGAQTQMRNRTDNDQNVADTTPHRSSGTWPSRNNGEPSATASPSTKSGTASTTRDRTSPSKAESRPRRGCSTNRASGMGRSC